MGRSSWAASSALRSLVQELQEDVVVAAVVVEVADTVGVAAAVDMEVAVVVAVDMVVAQMEGTGAEVAVEADTEMGAVEVVVAVDTAAVVIVTVGTMTVMMVGRNDGIKQSFPAFHVSPMQSLLSHKIQIYTIILHYFFAQRFLVELKKKTIPLLICASQKLDSNTNTHKTQSPIPIPIITNIPIPKNKHSTLHDTTTHYNYSM